MNLNFLRSSSSDQPLGGRYQIVEKLGAGGFGQTFRAQDLHLPGHPFCVVKQLKPQVDDAQGLQVARRLFDTEAKVLYRVGSHPQIPNLLAHFEQDKEFYLAQELIEGHSLEDEFANTPWNVPKVLNFLREVLETLAFVHENSVIHRDLKPSNLIRRKHDNRVVLIDFGAVKQVGSQPANTTIGQTISIGTHGYMPSEQLAGQPKFSSDVYAVGIMGIQALTGQLPQQLMPDATGEIDWHGSVPHISFDLRTVLDTMVRYDFRSRYPSAKEALAALQSLALPQSAPTPAASISTETEPAPTALTIPAMGRRPPTDAINRAATNVAPSTPPQRSFPLKPLLFGAVILVAGLLIGRTLTSTTAEQPTQTIPVDTAAEQPIQPVPTESTTEQPIEPAPTEPIAEQPIEPVPEEPAPSKPPEEPEEKSPLTPTAAQSTVIAFYSHISNQAWDDAKAQTSGIVAQQFDPDFFQQFQQVSVENLQVTAETPDSIELLGLNTYLYPDDTIQQEERTFTVEIIDDQPRIVDSTFVRITKPR